MLKSALNGVSSFLLVFVLSTAHADEALQPVDIAIGEWKPFVTRYVEGYGEIAEIVTVILGRMGYRPNYIFMPWGQAEAQVRQNESDSGPRATFPYRSSAQRRRGFLVSADPVFKACIRFFYNKDKVANAQPVSISKVADLARFKLGYVSEEGGYQYPEELAPVLKKGATKVDSLFELFSRLVDPASDVQVVPEVLEVGQDLLYELFPEQYFSIGVVGEAKGKNGRHDCLLPVEYFFLASRRNPNNTEFMREFDLAHGTIGDETAARIKRKAQERPSLRKPALVLRGHGSETLIKGRDADGAIYYLPRGTRGLLLSWRPPPRNTGNDPEARAEVRIITGPYRGKRLIVDGRHVELE